MSTMRRILLVICLIASQADALARGVTPQARELPQGYIDDNSDWWSFLRPLDTGPSTQPGKRELPATNFRILDVDLESDEVFADAISKLGPAKLTLRGDAS